MLESWNCSFMLCYVLFSIYFICRLLTIALLIKKKTKTIYFNCKFAFWLFYNFGLQ